MSRQPTSDLDAVAAAFRRFAAKECPGQSPLYAALSATVADNPALLELAAVAKPGQPKPNLLFAAAQLRLQQGAAHPLRNYYPNLVPAALPPENAGPAFREFCMREATDLEVIISSRVVGTNEVRRSACLLPALAKVGTHAGPFHLIEIGAAAGFNLLWDHYAYDYGKGLTIGPQDAELRLRCRLEGIGVPSLSEAFPKLLSRRGIDLSPVDASDEKEAAWLRALVWPEQRDRAARLEQAIAMARIHKPLVIAGDALAVLPDLLESIPPGEALCLSHAFTLNQFSADMRQDFEALLGKSSVQRPLFRIAYEWEAESPTLRLFSYDSAGRREELLARADAHGAWLEWLED